jgi:hypothetical protein
MKQAGRGGDWRAGFWPPASELSYSTPPAPNDEMWAFLAVKLRVAETKELACSFDGGGGSV